jgi:ERCC4-type nuclease
MIKIIIDNRENELIKIITQLISSTPNFKDLQIITENLPLGDIILTDGIDEKIIIERKSVNDLLSSIKDGRYEEQSYRLNGLEHHNHNIIYLIEGDINRVNRFKDTKIDKITLYSAIFSLNYFKGFSVLRTFNIEETAIYICNSANKLRKSELEKRKPYYINKKPKLENTIVKNLEEEKQKQNEEISNEEQNCEIFEKVENEEKEEKEQNTKDYVSVIKKVKKDNITPDNIGEIILCQIPGISSVTALAIMENYKSIPNLINCLQTDEKCLENISYINAKNQQRKITKTSINNISKFLLKK